MAYTSLQSTGGQVWRLARRQHGVVARHQLLALGFTSAWIKHRIDKRRLHVMHRGVYAVGRPELTRHGRWMAAVLRCGGCAVLSHRSAAALWEIRVLPSGAIEVSVPTSRAPRAKGIVMHRRSDVRPEDVTKRHGIPVTSPVLTLVDLASRLDPPDVEAAINDADKHGLVDPERLRAALDRMRGRRGVARLRRVLDGRTFALTDSELERRFLPIASRAGLGRPLTGAHVNGFKVDFHWPELGLLVETDGLRYHRTPAQQSRDRLRDQTHAAAGLTPLRFTHAQIRYEPARVEEILVAVAARLRDQSAVWPVQAFPSQ